MPVDAVVSRHSANNRPPGTVDIESDLVVSSKLIVAQKRGCLRFRANQGGPSRSTLDRVNCYGFRRTWAEYNEISCQRPGGPHSDSQGLIRTSVFQDGYVHGRCQLWKERRSEINGWFRSRRLDYVDPISRYVDGAAGG